MTQARRDSREQTFPEGLPSLPRRGQGRLQWSGFQPSPNPLLGKEGGPTKSIRNQHGQALVETGLVVTVLVILLLGIIELGRMWMILNIVTHALRDGARMAAVAPMTTSRDSCGFLTGTAKTAISNQVLSEISSVMETSTLTVPTISQTPFGACPVPAGVIPVVTVQVTGTVPFAFGLFGASLPLNRSVTFRDEGR
jgi:Flp pilus assembly protein TadG